MFSLNNKSVKNQIEELKSLVAEGKIVPTAGVDYNSVRAKFNLLTMSILIGSGLED
jgi:2-keto-3-deoxy-6-phosphogluconate aldolase